MSHQQRCVFCGRFISHEWESLWACFAYEYAAFCPDHLLPSGHQERQRVLREAS